MNGAAEIDVDLWSFLEHRVGRTPDRQLLRHRTARQSYADFHADAEATARALRAIGVREQDAVCLMLANGPAYLHLWFGLARLGAVKVPINVHLKGEGLAHIIRHSRARVAIVEAALLPRVLESTELIGEAPAIIVLGEIDELPPGCRQWSDLLAVGGPLPDAATPAPESVHAILYTSGTTGPAKGVMLSHRAYLNSARAFAAQFTRATPEDVFFTCLPLFHINAQAHTVLPAIDLNAEMAIGDRFHASAFWDEIHDSRATIFNLLGAMVSILCKQPPGAHDRDHGARLAACAATPVDVWATFEERFGVRVIEGYGLTETAGFCLVNPVEAVRVGSVGTPMDFVEARVGAGDGRRCAVGERGEILLRARESHAFMNGYFAMPEQTAEAMRGGWFHTGDMGWQDDDGYGWFVDRIKQSIRRRGENISSWEVEIVVNAHPDVLESAAVGVPSELGEEEVKICVVPRAGATIDPAEIVRWCAARMAYFMVPRYVEIREALPKTATERIEKYKLKADGVGGAWDRAAAGVELDRS